MTDIVERLRALEACETELAHDGDCPPEATANWKYAETCRLAAAEIARLSRDWDTVREAHDNLVCELDLRLTERRQQAAEIKRLRAALREIGGLDDEPKCCGRGIGGYTSPPECCGDPERGIDRAQAIARAALEERT